MPDVFVAMTGRGGASLAERNVAVVRRLLESATAIANADADWTPHITDFYDPDCSFHPVRKWPDQRPSHGREEMQGWFVDFYGNWDRVEFGVKSLTAIGDGHRVLAHATMTTEGRTSGVALAGDVYLCYWLRGGRVFHEEHHLTEAGATRALGLEGEASGPAEDRR